MDFATPGLRNKTRKQQSGLPDKLSIPLNAGRNTGSFTSTVMKSTNSSEVDLASWINYKISKGDIEVGSSGLPVTQDTLNINRYFVDNESTILKFGNIQPSDEYYYAEHLTIKNNVLLNLYEEGDSSTVYRDYCRIYPNALSLISEESDSYNMDSYRHSRLRSGNLELVNHYGGELVLGSYQGLYAGSYDSSPILGRIR